MPLMIFLFILGIFFLLSGGNIFVDGACALAKRYKMPEALIGATVVSIGTTLPEVTVSASAAIAGAGEVAYGNAIGSIICNTAFIAALTIAIKPYKAERKAIIIPVIFFFIAVAIYSFVSYTASYFSRGVGILLISLFLIYITVAVLFDKSKNKHQNAGEEGAINVRVKEEKLPLKKELLMQIKGERTSLIREVLMLILGAALIAFGADFVVDGAIAIANRIGIAQTVISLTVVAIGTSLPELITAVTSVVKGHGAISIGNIIGANLLNLVLVSGISIAISPFSVPTSAVIFTKNASLVLDIPLMLLAMLILTLPPLIRGRLYRWQGIALLSLYGIFLFCQILLVSPAV